jgi:hypothetical protein
VLREGKRVTLTVPLWVPQRLVPRTLLQKNFIDASSNSGTGADGSIVGGVPSYLMVGGLVVRTHTIRSHTVDRYVKYTVHTLDAD